MTSKQKTLTLRMARTLAATLMGLLAAWVSGPEVLNLVDGAAAQSFVLMVVVPMLTSLDKALRWGNDPGEG